MIRSVLSCECAFIDIIVCQTQGEGGGGGARGGENWEGSRTALRNRENDRH